MFCQNCGNRQEEGAKFCQGCGRAVAGEVTAPTEPAKIAEPLQAKIFLESGGILVSDVVFKTSSGASYPIRNISSVSVAEKPASWFVMLMAVTLTLFGLFVALGSIPVAFVIFALSTPFWYMVSNRPHQLKIGAGGVLQIAIENSNVNQLDSVARAINDSILYIQRGA